MTTQFLHHDPRSVQGFRYFSRVVGGLMIAVGMMALTGWWWDVPWLTTVLSSQLPMTVGAAGGFALSGVALLLAHTSGRWRTLAGSGLSLLVLGIGGAALARYVLALDLGIDPALVNAALHRSALQAPGLGGVVAVALVLLGGQGLLVCVRHGLWLRESLAVALLAIAMTGMAAHGVVLAGSESSLFSQVPTQTALLLLLATLGWMSVLPTTGLSNVVTAASLGGVVARRLLLPALLLPVGFTYVFELLRSWLGMPDVLTFALMAVFSGGTVAWLIWWVAVLLDRLEQQRQEALQLRSEADTDMLTGLANRRAFDEALTGLLQGHREHDTVFSLLMLDLDKFKSYNDDFGHLAGDEVLRITGRLLRDAVRPSDLAARYGGEEFAMLLSATDAIKAGEVAARVMDAFHAFAWPHRAITISIGVAQSAPGDSFRGLVERADTALYAAKHAGRDQVVHARTSLSPAAVAG